MVVAYFVCGLVTLIATAIISAYMECGGWEGIDIGFLFCGALLGIITGIVWPLVWGVGIIAGVVWLAIKAIQKIAPWVQERLGV